MKKILLMTGTIKPFADVSYKDPKTRYMEYQKNIKRYIKESNFDIIIFAENSGAVSYTHLTLPTNSRV